MLRPSLLLSWALCALACGDPEPSIAGAWVHCEDEECNKPLEWGWYFPPDHGGLRRVAKNSNSSGPRLCAGTDPEPIYAQAKWEEVEDGVLIRDVVGIEDRVLKRHGDLLETANDGFVEFNPSPDSYPYMKKVDGVEPCP